MAAVPEFLTSFSPLPEDPDAPIIVRSMLTAGAEYGVGPMAAVAGAVAQEVGRELLAHTPEVIVENGGDIFLMMSRPVRLGLYAGPDSPFTGKIVLKLKVCRSESGCLHQQRHRGTEREFRTCGCGGHHCPLSRACRCRRHGDSQSHPHRR